MPDKITTLKLIDNTDVFPNIKDENIPNTIMRIADLSKYLNQLKSINITGDIDSTTITSDIATFTNVHVDGNIVVNGIDNIVDKNANKIINTGTFDPTSDNPAGQKSVYNMPIQFENIVDSQGKKRFVDGNINKTPQNTSIEQIYGKWSLSGTHLLLVFCFNHLANKTLSNRAWIATAGYMPNYIMDKILPISGNIVGIFPYHRGATNTSSYVALLKPDNVSLVLAYYGDSYTPTADEISRVQIDLLIDSD